MPFLLNSPQIWNLPSHPNDHKQRKEGLMTLNPCQTCGRPIRLRVVRMAINGRQGVGQWLSNADGDTDCPCLKDWCWDKMRSDKSKPTPFERKRDEWNALNPT